MNSRCLPAAAALAASALLLAGCAGSTEPDDGRVSVVASTSVYGQIAEAIGGELVDVTSIVSSASQDPHSFEPSAQDRLAVSRADLVIENGGGYDAFVDALIEANGTAVPVVTAVESAPDWIEPDDAAEHIEGFNEHVWYDPAIMADVADRIAGELSDLQPENADEFASAAADFRSGTDELVGQIARIAQSHGGDAVLVTEPVPLRMTDAAGLVDLTPPAFSEAVEEGQDVPASALLDSIMLLQGYAVNVVIANSQTGGAETSEILTTARTAGIPVLEFTETLPDGSTYLEWMRQNITDLTGAL